MIEFAKTNRTTTYFRDDAIYKIYIAYRIMEYLAPDDNFPPRDLDKHTKELMLLGQYEEAYERVFYDISITDLGSSSGSEVLRQEAIELMKYLAPIYSKNIKDVKEKRKLELLKELRQLEAAENKVVDKNEA